MLIALVTAQRAQTLSLLKITNMFRSEGNVIFCLDEHVKQSRVSNFGPLVVLRPFTENRNLCVVHTLDVYLRKTELLRGTGCRLFIGLHKPHAAVGVDTISRWMKSILFESGIDTSVFSGHSTRSASTSAALNNNVDLLAIMKAAGWKNAGTFGKYYKKVVCDVSFSAGVLSNTHHTQ